MELCLATFHKLCVPASDLKYKGRDRLGVQTGDAFDNALYAVAHGKLTRSSASLRGTRDLFATTPEQALLDLMAKTNSYVREIRCHYPIFVRGRKDPLIIERMITVERRDTPGEPHLHAVTCSLVDLQKVRRWLDLEGVTYEVFDPSSISTLQERNAAFLYGMARGVDILEPSIRERSARLAQRLYESERRKERRRAAVGESRYRECHLDGLVTRIARLEQMSFDEAYTHIAIGLILGFICLMPGHELNPLTPLRLHPPLVRFRM